MSASMETANTVLVTGASSGIGRSAALRFAAAGWQVVATARRKDLLDGLAGEMVACGGREPMVLPGDLSADGAERPVLAAAAGITGRLDAVVHCAATAVLVPFGEATREQFDSTVSLNLRTTFFLLQGAWLQMKGQGGGGTIIAISSLAAVDPFDGFCVYGSSKAWLDSLVRSMAREGRRHGIRAFSIRPGAVETPMLRGLFPKFPAAQTVRPEDIAAVACALTDPAWQHSSGKAFDVSAQV